jgi:hypothetical protein
VEELLSQWVAKLQTWQMTHGPYPLGMSVLERDLSTHVIQAFPPWLDLPPGYIVNDWIAWQKGKLVADKIRETPSLLETAINRLLMRGDKLFAADYEWLELLRAGDIAVIARILEADDNEGQRWRSSSPFSRTPFIEPEEAEAIYERAYLG